MIKDKLKEIRENHHMNKKEFANYIGMKYTTYNGYETGAREPDSDFLIRISKKFDVSIDYILGLVEDKERLHSYQLRSVEYDYIQMYRQLDSHGRKMVDFTIKEEWERSNEINKNHALSTLPDTNLQKDYLLPRAAHNEDATSEGQLYLMKEDAEDIAKL